MHYESQDVSWLLREKYNNEKSEAFFADYERLASGEPLAYVIGSIPFLNCNIYLDSKPLIPRPETEFWVEQAIVSIREHVAQGSPRQGPGEPWAGVRVLDLCAGSGAIGVAVAKAIPGAHVTFAELDPTHLPTIQKNLIYNLNNDDRMNTVNCEVSTDTAAKPFNRLKGFEIVVSDIFSNITGTFDFILTNPPYIDETAETVDRNVVEYEPHLALFGGVAGMEIIERIIDGARAKLAPQGQLWLEHEPFQSEAIAALAHTHGFSAQTFPDQYGTLRYSILTIAVPK